MTRSEDELIIRPAAPQDGPSVVELVRGLAELEKLTPPDDAAAARLLQHAFGPEPRYELLVGELAGKVRAYAAFFEIYSTFRALPSLYLEDLFVHPEARGRTLGTRLVRHLARLAVERGCGRLEWSVLAWNVAAQRFYRSLGARVFEEWQLCRVDGAALSALAET